MKKAFLFLSAFFFAAELFAFQIPEDRNGNFPLNIEEVGVNAYTVRYSSQPFLIPGSTVMVYGVLTSTKSAASATVQSFVELRATGTANITSELLVPPILFSSTTRNTFVQYSPPKLSPGGLSVNISTVADATVTIFYRYLSTGVRENFYIPESDGGVRAHSHEFYGVNVASSVASGGIAGDGIGTESFDLTSAEKLISSERGLLFEINAGTGSSTNFVTFISSTGVGSSNSILMAPIFYNTFTLESFVNNAINATVRFPWGVICPNGLTQQRNVATDRIRYGYRSLLKTR